MRRLLIMLVAVLIGAAGLAVGYALPVTGQGTGGTVGPKAVGQKVFQVRFSENQFGVHCANTNNRRACERNRRAPIGSLAAANAAVYEGDARVGSVHFVNVVTRRATNNQGRGLVEYFAATVVLSDGSVTLQGAGTGEGSPPVPSSITGGTGAYAGARGYATQEPLPGREFRLNVTVTFIP